MVEDNTLATTLNPHLSGYTKVKDSMHLAVKGMSTQQNVGNQKFGGKSTLENRGAHLGIRWENAPRKAYFWPWRYGTSRCKESKLSLADTASLLLVFGMVLDRHCHYYLRVGLRGSTQVSSLGCISLPRLRAIGLALVMVR